MENNNEIKSKKVEFSIGKNFLEDLINKIDDKDLIAVDDLNQIFEIIPNKKIGFFEISWSTSDFVQIGRAHV